MSASPSAPPPSVEPLRPESVPPPRTQQKTRHRQRWPEWAKQLPYLKLPPADPQFTLIPQDELKKYLQTAAPRADRVALTSLMDDLNHLERELIPLFRERDAEAKLQQNRYRFYQLAYIILAMVATVIGSFLALALNENPPHLVPLWAFLETVVALLAVFLATISGRESPYATWLDNRNAAEGLRREYFRYLMHLPPYDTLEGYQRQILLSERAALINRGTSPDDKTTSNLNGAGNGPVNP